MLRRCSLPDRGEYRQAAGVAAQGLDPRLFTPLWPRQNNKKDKGKNNQGRCNNWQPAPYFQIRFAKASKAFWTSVHVKAFSRSKFGAALRARHYTGVGHARKDKVKR